MHKAILFILAGLGAVPHSVPAQQPVESVVTATAPGKGEIASTVSLIAKVAAVDKALAIAVEPAEKTGSNKQ